MVTDIWGRPKTLADTLGEPSQPRSFATKPKHRARRPGVLAGKLAAGVSSLLASNPEAPVELQELASKQVQSLLASRPGVTEEFAELASKLHPPGWPVPELASKLDQRAGGHARAAKLSPERRHEIAVRAAAASRRRHT